MRLIDADAFTEFLKDAIKRQKYEDTKIDGLLTVADVIEAVISDLDGTSLDGFKNAPTIDAVSVVRCRDCKHWDNEDDAQRCSYTHNGLHWAKPDDYCSCGERRTE